jgi:hypothetical protein
MKMTIEQVREDIKSGKCKRIYYSSRTLWWTHLDSDVDEATKMGKIASDKAHEIFMERKDIPQSEKLRYSNLREMANKSISTIPLDPTGSTLFQTDDLMDWITEAEKKPEHFGKHGLQAFMMSHHQNCNICFSGWDGYNNLIDNEK